MNIFVSDRNAIIAAQNLDSKRVVKMILEGCQLLSGAINLNGGQAPYKTTHANHPSAIWARQTRSNWIWLYEHTVALGKEYTFRYGKMHKCYEVLKTIKDMDVLIPDGPLTTFANCAAHGGKEISYKHLNNVVEAYRHYLVARWNTDKLAVNWHQRGKPSWLELDKDGKYCYIGIND